MTKVNIISGFLGAGKTTLIKELLSKVFVGEKVVLIENEFGEIGIDGGFLKEAGVAITEMNSGCICCTLVGDFSKALQEVLAQFHPDRIIIEPSGVGKLSDVAKAVREMKGKEVVELERCITVVDAQKAKVYLKNFGEFFLNQVENADVLVLSRTDSIAEEKLQACVHLLREHNTHATLITTPWDQLDQKAFESAIFVQSNPENMISLEECVHHHHHHEDHDHECHHDHEHHDHECHHDHEHHDHECHHDHEHQDHVCHHAHHHHHADEIFSSWGKETIRQYDLDELKALLHKLAETQEFGQVLRAKGIVSLHDGSWVQFDLVPQEQEIRPCGADYIGRICVIGTHLDEEALKVAFGL